MTWQWRKVLPTSLAAPPSCGRSPVRGNRQHDLFIAEPSGDQRCNRPAEYEHPHRGDDSKASAGSQEQAAPFFHALANECVVFRPQCAHEPWLLHGHDPANSEPDVEATVVAQHHGVFALRYITDHDDKVVTALAAHLARAPGTRTEAPCHGAGIVRAFDGRPELLDLRSLGSASGCFRSKTHCNIQVLGPPCLPRGRYRCLGLGRLTRRLGNRGWAAKVPLDRRGFLMRLYSRSRERREETSTKCQGCDELATTLGCPCPWCVHAEAWEAVHGIHSAR